LLGDNDIGVSRFSRGWDTLTREAEFCLSRWPKLPVKEQKDFYLSEGCPDNTGIFMGGLIVRRHTKAIARLNELWWEQITKFSQRDQLSLPYVLWKLGITPSILPSPKQDCAENTSCIHGHSRHLMFNALRL